MIIEKFPNILPNQINEKIISFLIDSPHWRITRDEGTRQQLQNNLLNTNNSDFGFNIQTFDEIHNLYLDSPLNLYAEMIYFIIKDKSKYKFLKPVRFFWNYYNKSSTSNFHSDMPHKNYISFVYNLHNNSGGTEIINTKGESEFFISNQSEAVVFPSYFSHRGHCSKNTTGRFNLNCIVEIELKNENIKS